MFRLVPPAGSPLRVRDLGRAFGRRLAGTPSGFVASVSNYFAQGNSATPACFLLSSGRAAQAVALSAIRQTSSPERTSVILPAWTCYTVAASIVRAGLRVQPVDIDPRTLDYSDQLEKTDLSKCAALIACNLFGIPNDMRRLRTIAANAGAVLIDDAAQAFGLASSAGPCGGCGDIGMVSLDRGKNLSTYSGGILVVRVPRLAGIIASAYRDVPVPSLRHDMALAVKMAAVGLLSHPRLYWLPNKLPFLGIGTTVYDPGFAITKLGHMQESYGDIVWPGLKALNDSRKQNAVWLAERIAPMKNYSIPGYTQGHVPTYLRFPLLAPDRAARDRAVATLRRYGIGGGRMYPDTLDNVPQLRAHLLTTPEEYPGARQVSDQLFTVPTHPRLSQSDRERIIRALIEAAG